eukprot:13604-Hanusia_phi.AAC.3
MSVAVGALDVVQDAMNASTEFKLESGLRRQMRCQKNHYKQYHTGKNYPTKQIPIRRLHRYNTAMRQEARYGAAIRGDACEHHAGAECLEGLGCLVRRKSEDCNRRVQTEIKTRLGGNGDEPGRRV